MEMVKLNIDGKPLEVPQNTTILKAARTVGIDIPTLCYFQLKDLNIENRPGGCRRYLSARRRRPRPDPG